MAIGRESFLAYACRWRARPDADGSSDAALLGRFIADRDEAAFATLVSRHGPLVLHVCRRVLGDSPEVEDAFQAAFLVLARRAPAVSPREAVAAWLHGVAHRVALKARTARARRLRTNPLPDEPPADPRPDPLGELSARELLAIVDAEVRRLPTAYRLPVILCCLEGRSLEETARQLGWTSGSVKGRLERGRARLHDRLARRGLTLSAALVAIELSRGGGSAQTVASTTHAAITYVTGRLSGERAAALASQAVRGMTLARLKIPTAALLAASLVAAGLTLVPAPGPSANVDQSTSRTVPPAPRDDIAIADAGPPPREVVDRVEVSGRVLDFAGRPFAGAQLYVGYAPRRYDSITGHVPEYPVRATSGPDGKFRFAFRRSELDVRYMDASRPVVVAVADGFGLDFAELGKSSETAAVTMKLVEDLPVEGRIVDEEGEPLRGVTVLVRELYDGSPEGLTRYLRNGDQASFRSCRGPLPGLPARTTTDADGRFRLNGAGRDRVLLLGLEGTLVTHTDLTVVTRPAAEVTNERGIDGATFEYTSPAPRTIRGVVRDENTRRPISGVRVSTDYYCGPSAVTDRDGKYELTGCSHQTTVVLAHPVGEPYFACGMRVRFQPGRRPFVANFDLVAGIDLRGRVIDEATGKPPKQATVAYYPLYPNPHSGVLCNLATRVAPSSTPVQADGSYRLTVLPGPGIVVIAASPRDSYAGAWMDDNELAGIVGQNNCGKRCSESWVHTAIGGRKDGFSLDRYNGLGLINPADDAKAQALDLTVRPAPAIRGTVVSPDGQAITGVRVTGLSTESMAEILDSAAFKVEGMNPRATRELTFHHRESGLSAVVTVRGDQSEPLTVRLSPCGVVRGRLVNKSGKPLSGAAVGFYGRISGTEVITETDDDGRFRADLIAGREYSVGLPGGHRFQMPISGVQVESGRDKYLGALRVTD